MQLYWSLTFSRPKQRPPVPPPIDWTFGRVLRLKKTVRSASKYAVHTVTSQKVHYFVFQQQFLLAGNWLCDANKLQFKLPVLSPPYLRLTLRVLLPIGGLPLLPFAPCAACHCCDRHHCCYYLFMLRKVRESVFSVRLMVPDPVLTSCIVNKATAGQTAVFL